jgi:acyl dehydratase
VTVAVRPRRVFADVSVGEPLPALEYPVTASTVVLGALATRDWRPMHHDKAFATERNGTKDIFLNTPTQAAWFERYLTDWSGPHGRLAWVRFRMKGSVFPGDTMTLSGVVESTEVDASGCAFVTVGVTLSVDGDAKTTCTARLALPLDEGDNPWARRGDQWRPAPESGPEGDATTAGT